MRWVKLAEPHIALRRLLRSFWAAAFLRRSLQANHCADLCCELCSACLHNIMHYCQCWPQRVMLFLQAIACCLFVGQIHQSLHHR
jgi:hypothetical protein